IITAKANLGLDIKIKLELNIDFFLRHDEISFASDASSIAEFGLGGTAAIDINLCLGNFDYKFLGVISVGIEPTLTLGFEASVNIKTAIEYHFNFKYIKDECNNEWTTDNSIGSADNVKNDFEMEGNVSVTFNLKPNISVISHKFIEFELSIPFEFKINVKDNGLNPVADSTVILGDGNTNEDTMHLCDKCLLITPTLTASVIGEAKLPIIGKTELTIMEREYTFTKWYYSSTTGKHGMDECPNQGYLTELHFVGTDKISNATLPVWIDGKLNTVTDTDGNIVLYCKSGSHNYSVTAGAETKKDLSA
ncbi:MAG TPA: hypothetical protein PLS20_11475, partial [Ruminococcus flavefaciens]|nr:hypothetical protein [Ruminococcus flavefaciens]